MQVFWSKKTFQVKRRFYIPIIPLRRGEGLLVSIQSNILQIITTKNTHKIVVAKAGNGLVFPNMLQAQQGSEEVIFFGLKIRIGQLESGIGDLRGGPVRWYVDRAARMCLIQLFLDTKGSGHAGRESRHDRDVLYGGR